MTQDIRRLWLVRHGATRWSATNRFCGYSDILLSRTGHAQGRWLAQRLQRENIQAIYSSDLKRARDTAEYIAAYHQQPVSIKISALWREINFGDWEGLTYHVIAEQYKDQLAFFTDPLHHAPPNGESLADLLQRLQLAITQILTETTEGEIAIVSHGGPLRVLLCCMLRIPIASQWQLRLDPGSLSAIDLLADSPRTREEHTLQESFPAGILVTLNIQRPVRTHRTI
jgi:alpha-ribazole phosphatase